jgi:hypothetical protein
MLTNQLGTTEETLDLLKRVKLWSQDVDFQKLHNQPQSHNPNASRPSTLPVRNNNRFQTQHHVKTDTVFAVLEPL